MRKMTLIWLVAAATLAILLSGRSALAQEPASISDSDVARLRAFIGDNNFDASPSPGGSATGASSLPGDMVAGVYTVRPGDTLSEIMATHLGDTGVNHDVMQHVIVRTNKSAFRRGNPHWLMAGAKLRMPTVTDVMDYVIPGQKSQRVASSDEWVRYP